MLYFNIPGNNIENEYGFSIPTKGVMVVMNGKVDDQHQKLGLWLLTFLVVGNMVGSGIFMLPRQLAQAAGPAAVITAWLFTGAGVLMLALVFGTLAVRKPELSGGPQLYAKALFREGSEKSLLAGYLATWGYWIANWAGNVGIITTFASYASAFLPIMTSQAELYHIDAINFSLKVGNLVSFLVSSALLWGVHFIILRGVQGAGKLNFWATLAKIGGFIFFVLASLFAFQQSNLLPLTPPRMDELGQPVDIIAQIRNASLATLWAFIGVESAVVFSSRARKPSDVRWATVIGLFIAVLIYVGITILVMGTLKQEQLMVSEKPMADALSSIIGPSGSWIMSALVLLSLAGSMIGWVLLSAEIPYQAAKQRLFPSFFLRENKQGAPSTALFITNVMMQFLLFSILSKSIAKAFDFVSLIAILSVFIPYLIAAIYQVKLVSTGETYFRDSSSRVTDGIIGITAVIYSVWVMKVATSDLGTFLFGLLLIGIGLFYYPQLRKELRYKN